MSSRSWSPRSFYNWWARGLKLGVLMLSAWTVLGTLGFRWLEGWSFADAFYMTVITVSTVGYGEVHPLSGPGRMFASFLIVGGLATAVYTFTRLGQVILEGELFGGFGRRRMKKELGELENHFILCGFGRAAKPVAEAFSHKKLPFCVIEADRDVEATLRDLGYLHRIGDATADEVLIDAGIARARAVLTLLPSDADNLYVTVTAKALSPDVRVIARALDERGETKLRRAGANEVILPYNLAGHRIVQAATSPAVLEFMKHIADQHYMEMNLVEARVSEKTALAGQTIQEAGLRSDFDVIVVAIRRDSQGMIFNPGPDATLEPGDVLVLMGHAEKLAATQSALEGHDATD